MTRNIHSDGFYRHCLPSLGSHLDCDIIAKCRPNHLNPTTQSNQSDSWKPPRKLVRTLTMQPKSARIQEDFAAQSGEQPAQECGTAQALLIA
jgi:hypothetical protein